MCIIIITHTYFPGLAAKIPYLALGLSFYFPWSWNATFALFMNLVCKELNSNICLCWWNIKAYLCYMFSCLNGQFCYGQTCCQFCGWYIMFLVFHFLSWLNGQLYYEQSIIGRCTFQKYWLHFCLLKSVSCYNLEDMINSCPYGIFPSIHFNE